MSENQKFVDNVATEFYGPANPQPTEAQKRKGQPVARGVLAYFGDAIAYVAEVSAAGSKQHHPGAPLHWDRSKSMDHLDCLARHLTDHLMQRPVDTDGIKHLGKVAWRALASLQLAIEAEREGK